MGATSTILIDDSIGNGPAMIFDVYNGRDVLAHYKDGSETFALMSDGFMRTSSGWQYRQVSVGIGDIAANNDAWTYPLLRCKHDVTITGVSIACDTTVVAGSSYQTIYLEQSGNTTDLSSLSTASVGFTLHVPRGFTIATAGDPDHLAAGDTLQLRFEKTSSGVAMYGVTVSITYTIDQPKATIGTSTDNLIRINNEIGSAAAIKVDSPQRPFLSVRENGTEKLRIDAAGKMHGTNADQYFYHVINTGQLVTADSGAKIVPLFSPHCTCQIEAVYMGATETDAIGSNTNYWQVKITDATNILVDHHIIGPYGAATALVKGVFVDMGDVNPEYGEITSSEKICAEFLEGGTGPDIDGLTFVIVYRKLT